MPTSGSRASTVQAPAWLARLLTPFIARAVARFVAAVVARLPDAASGQEAAQPVSVWVLIGANLLPLYAVLFWGWEVFPLLVLFWIENVIVGVLNAGRMLLLDPRDAAFWAAKLFMVPFFCFHYGMFTAIHGVFVLSMFGHGKTRGFELLGPAMDAVGEWNLWLPAGALLASHLFSFFSNHLHRGEFRRASLPELMMRPYARVMILHVTLLLGGFGVLALGSPLWALLVLVALKIGIDLKAHLKEHRV